MHYVRSGIWVGGSDVEQAAALIGPVESNSARTKCRNAMFMRARWQQACHRPELQCLPEKTESEARAERRGP
jgi:hypothetical protein